MHKIAAVIYFAVLFLIMASYIAFSIPNKSADIRISSTETLSEGQNNLISFWISDVREAASYEGYTLAISWAAMDSERRLTDCGDPQITPIDQSGRGTASMPSMPPQIKNCPNLAVHLINPQNETIKTACIPADTFASQSAENAMHWWKDTQIILNDIDIFAPSEFVMGRPNTVFAAAFEHGKPLAADIHLETINGTHAVFPSRKHAFSSGITPFDVTISSPVDMKFSISGQIFYQTFIPHMKPFHAVIDSPLLTPDRAPLLTLTPVGTPTDIIVDYFIGADSHYAWIDRQTVSASNSAAFTLRPNWHFIQPAHDSQDTANTPTAPSVLYARVSASAYPDQDSSQIFAILASSQSISLCRSFAVLNQTALHGNAILETVHQNCLRQGLLIASNHRENLQTVYAEETATELSMQQTHAAEFENMAQLRDYLLARLGTYQTPEIALRIRTDKDDDLLFDETKRTHKRIANKLLTAWFALGVIAGIAILVQQAKKRRQFWLENLANIDSPDNVDSLRSEEMMSPPGISPFAVIAVIVLFIGTLYSLYFMMQIL